MGGNDLGLYDRHADAWWDPESKAFRSLHSVDRFRAARLVAELAARGAPLDRALGPATDGAERARGALVVDLGCGGGIVAALLGAAGARVVGVDRSRPSLLAARAGARPTPALVLGDAAAPPLREGVADLVVLSDVLEHVPDPAATVAAAAALVRPGGHLYASTLNRTRRARWLAVELAERLGYVPRGTHDPRLFVRPDELERAAASAGLALVDHVGEGVDVLATLRRRRVVARPSRSLAVAYQSLFVRPSAGPRP